MIGGQAFDFLISVIEDIYLFGKTHIAIRFGQFSLSYWDLWTSFSAIVLFLHMVLAPIFGQYISIKIPRSKESDDSV